MINCNNMRNVLAQPSTIITPKSVLNIEQLLGQRVQAGGVAM